MPTATTLEAPAAVKNKELVAWVHEMAALVTGHLLRVDGVAHTETLTAFQAYSRHDLERMFGL